MSLVGRWAIQIGPSARIYNIGYINNTGETLTVRKIAEIDGKFIRLEGLHGWFLAEHWVLLPTLATGERWESRGHHYASSSSIHVKAIGNPSPSDPLGQHSSLGGPFFLTNYNTEALKVSNFPVRR